MNDIGLSYMAKTTVPTPNSGLYDVVDFLSSPSSINKMIVASELGLPALTGVVQELEEKYSSLPGFELNYDADDKNAPNRRTVGWIIKHILKQFGYYPKEDTITERSRLRRFSKNKYFHSGAIYVKVSEGKYELDLNLIKK